MSGRKAWLAVVLAFILGAGATVTAMTLLRGSPATSVDPIRLESPTDSGNDKVDSKKDGQNKDKREKPSGGREQPSSGGAPAAPPAPPAPAGNDDDDDDGDDDSGDDDDD